jgi:hypothetical protein
MNSQAFPLKDAYLCTDCDQVGNCATQCLCGSTHGLLSLSAVLNRRKPVMAETTAILAMLHEVGQERFA